MQAQDRPCRLFHRSGSEKVIKMGVRVQDMADGQTELLHFMENTLRGATRIDHHGLLRHRITDDRAVASERRD